MKSSLVTIGLVAITVASLGYGYLQHSSAAALQQEVDAANTRALTAEQEATRQREIANASRAAAEIAAHDARAAQLRAEQAMAECMARKKK